MLIKPKEMTKKKTFMNQKQCLNTNHVYGTYSMKLMMLKIGKEAEKINRGREVETKRRKEK
jgi:hypothetical protein